VDVSTPQRSLEEYFLNVVREAQRDKLVTAGAESGTRPSGFLMGEEDSGERLVQDLVEAGHREAKAEGPARPEPVPVIHTGADDALIGDLLARAAGGEKGEKEEAPEAETAKEVGVRKDVLDELLDGGSGNGKADEGKN